MKKLHIKIPVPDKGDVEKTKDAIKNGAFKLGKQSRAVRRTAGRFTIRFGNFLHGKAV